MDREFFDPPPDQIRVIAVGAASLRQAEELILACEFCHRDDAEIPLDWILDKVTGRLGSTTDDILTESARCPHCKRDFAMAMAFCGTMSFLEARATYHPLH